ncbi:hypothetical protein VTJ04DRAFT_3534 [Mycothermus thermophilus]|uniref:uncharacterized protein n=1 Tax=Humicola insolens TaxID=85995 RepID=UPI003743D531
MGTRDDSQCSWRLGTRASFRQGGPAVAPPIVSIACSPYRVLGPVLSSQISYPLSTSQPAITVPCPIFFSAASVVLAAVPR